MAITSMIHSKERSLTKTMNDKLRAAAQDGDIDRLYKLIQEDQHILEHVDGIPFAETPLHIAAEAGNLQFATEIMRLKPSFAWKLNQLGFSPIHLALQEGQKRMVLRFIDINKELVRVKGREGQTPLHFVSQNGDIDLLANFLKACPDSIEDVTVTNETALHIAVKNKQFQSLEVLIGWLKKTHKIGAWKLERIILNSKDEAGNTILHISALLNNSQALQLMIKSKMDLNAKNLENLTALDIATTAEMKRILVRAGAKHGSSVTDAPTLADKLRSKITFVDQLFIFKLRIEGDLSEDKRNALLVVAALIITAIYQTSLSPPGGVYPADIGANNNLNTTSSLQLDFTPGTSVMDDIDFIVFWSLNTVSFSVTTLVIYLLTPSVHFRYILFGPMLYFASCFLYSMKVISPTASTDLVSFILFVLFFLVQLFVELIPTPRNLVGYE